MGVGGVCAHTCCVCLVSCTGLSELACTVLAEGRGVAIVPCLITCNSDSACHCIQDHPVQNSAPVLRISIS